MQVSKMRFMPIEEDNLKMHAHFGKKILLMHLILTCTSRFVFLLTPDCHRLGHISGLSLIYYILK